MAKPTATSGNSSIDTSYLPHVNDESIALDAHAKPIGLHGKSGMPGPLADKEVRLASGLKLMVPEDHEEA